MKNLNKLVVCNFCHSREQRQIIPNDQYSIVKCSFCNLIFLSPRPSKQEIKNIYKDEYFEHGEVGSGYTDYNCIGSDLIKEAHQRLRYIKRFCTKGKLLDAGCGFGTFLSEADKEKFLVQGCDIAKDAINEVKKKYQLPATVADIIPGQLPKGPFDVITAWDVIEHMTDPIKSFKAFYQSQKRGGYLFLTTPNVESIDAKILGHYWYGFKRIPEHLYYFSPVTIRNLLEVVGYKVVEIKQWGFQRNLAYCVEQVARYNVLLGNILTPISQVLKLKNISVFFPFIEMLIVAKKPKN